jgi:hypothetical protein
MIFVPTTDVIESYKLFFEVKYPGHFQTYCNRSKNKPESAKAEAVTFSFMRSTFVDVTLAEDISTGGVDFLCKSNEVEFIIEVTCLEAEAVAAQSGWKNEVAENGAGGSFGMITHMLRTKASSIATQLSGHDSPRILSITCEHVAADVLLIPHGAETFLTSDIKIEVPIGKAIADVKLITDLKDSIFFRSQNGQLESCRRSISAIVLFSIFADKSLIIGILHPDPAYSLPIKLFPSIPFLRMKKWPPENNMIEIEWVIYKPKPQEFSHRKVKFKDNELRSI